MDDAGGWVDGMWMWMGGSREVILCQSFASLVTIAICELLCCQSREGR